MRTAQALRAEAPARGFDRKPARTQARLKTLGVPNAMAGTPSSRRRGRQA